MYTHITLAVSAVESLVSLRARGAKVLYYSLVFPSIWNERNSDNLLIISITKASVLDTLVVWLSQNMKLWNIKPMKGMLKKKNWWNVEKIDERSVREGI